MENKEKNFISAVVYIRNNQETVENFLTELHGALSGLFERFEIICVDDASEDKSVERIRRYAKERENITLTLLQMSHFHGLELSMDAGNDLSIGDFVYEFDSCLCDYDTGLIEEIYRKSQEGYDIVAAVPDQKLRKSSGVFYTVFQKFSAQRINMKTERFRILSRRAINRIHMMNDSIPYRKVIYANCGLHTACVTYHSSVSGLQTGEKREMTEYRMNLALDSLILFTQAGYKISVRLTTGMMLVTLICALYAAGIFLNGRAITGWTTTMLFLSLAFCGLFGILTVVIKYLSILVHLIFHKKKYTYGSIEKISRE